MTLHLRAAVGLFALGAIGGPLLDAIHTHTGTTAYAEPRWLLSVWWCPPLFAFAGVAVGFSRPLLDRALRQPAPAPSLRAFVLAQVLFVGSYAASGLLPFSSAEKTVVLGVVFAIAWALCDRSALGLMTAGLVAAGGWAVEATLVRRGLFSHRDPDLLGVAQWIPFLYGTASIAIGQVGRRLLTARPSSGGSAGI